MNSCNTDIFFSNYYLLQSVRFELTFFVDFFLFLVWKKVIYPYFFQWPVLTPRTTFPWVAKQQTIVELLRFAVIDSVTHLAVGVT